MFEIFLFKGYSRRTSNYPKRIALYDPTHLMSMDDPIAIGVETLRIYSECYLEKEFFELFHMNPLMVIIPQLLIRFIHVMIVYVVL